MSFKNPTSLKDALIHVGVVAGAGLVLVLFVFFVWLPVTTNHGETITVPDIRGLTVDELEEFLGRRDLRFEVTADSSYSPDHEPLAVLRQVPKPNTKVKENRKIYVTLNAERPPLIRMPKVEDLSLNYALRVLRSYDLKRGNIRYIPDDIFGVVHEAKMKGRTVLEGERIEKGSEIDLVVGDGLGKTAFQSPNLIGLEQEEAEFVIIGSGLKVGQIRMTNTASAGFMAKDPDGEEIIEMRDVSPGSVQEQSPKAGQDLKIGDPIDLWIYMPDSVSTQKTILDN